TPKPQPALLVDRAVERFAQLPGVGVPTKEEAERRDAPAHTDPHLVCLLGAALRRAPPRRSPVHHPEAATGEAAQVRSQYRRQRPLHSLKRMGWREAEQKRVPRPGQLIREDRLADRAARRGEAIVRPRP